MDQLADRTQAAVAEVVDVVGFHRHLDAARNGHRGLTLVQADQIFDGGHDVFFGQRRRRDGLADMQPELVDLIATDAGQVVALLLEEQVFQQRLR